MNTRSRSWSLALAVIAAVLAVGLFVVLRDDDGDSASGGSPSGPAERSPSAGPSERSAAIPTIVVRSGEPVGGVRELSFAAGDRIRFAVRSDIADEVHLHGYDISKPISPGREVRFDVAAELEGGYEVELENAKIPIAEIAVNPG